MGDKRIVKLLIIPILIYVFSRATLNLLPPNDWSVGHTVLWLALIAMPFVAFVAIYLFAESKRGRRVSLGRMLLFSVPMGLLIAVLAGGKTIVGWLFNFEKRNTLVSRSFVWLMTACHGWLFPVLILGIFFSFVLIKWRRAS